MNTNTEEARNIFKWAWIALVILSIFLAIQALASLKNLRDKQPAYNTISVSGQGEAVAVPDVATFTFTVSADAQNVSDAQAQVTAKVDKILTSLKNMGIEDRDIKTTDYSVYPKYTYDQIVCSPGYCPPARQKQDGYTASHNVMVKVRKTEDAGKALAVAGDNGATNISGINLTIDEPEKLIAEARSKAIANAREKADQLTKDLGVKIVRVVSFYDSTDGGGPLPYGISAEKDMALGSAVAVPTIPTGENKTTVTATIIYEIR